MKTSALYALLLATMIQSCSQKHFSRHDAAAESGPPVEVAAEVPELPDIPTSITADEVTKSEPDTPKVVVESETITPPVNVSKNESFMLEVSKLKHDALYKNCLDLELDGKTHRIACNKDFAIQEPRVFTLSGTQACYKMTFTMTTFTPKNTADCIQRIQKNRDSHQCDYNTQALLTSKLGNSPRFRMNGKDGATGTATRLTVEFEDSDGAATDFNDYVFSLVSKNTSYFKVGQDALEYCLPK